MDGSIFFAFTLGGALIGNGLRARLPEHHLDYESRDTVNLGIGLRVMPLDWLAVHADVRDHIFDIDLLGQEKTAHNIETHVGVTFFF